MPKGEDFVDGLTPTTSSLKQDPRDADPVKLNPEVREGERVVFLTRGFITTVDESEYERVMRYSWHANIQPHGDGHFKIYAVRGRRASEGFPKGAKQYLHRFLVLAEEHPDIHVDHLDGNSLRNSLKNLAPGLPIHNKMNLRCGGSGNVPEYVGVYRFPSTAKNGNSSKPFEASFNFMGERFFCGRFATAYEAALARDTALLEEHKKWGIPPIVSNNVLNFPHEDTEEKRQCIQRVDEEIPF
ncbi:hypothetical protein COU17_01320 [Candidatus Kaiserbacteria bacterium CG10_big_fil_rev_8_21_14_0_10_49_17]|uniref:Uncharacterized protein n=1 Tax=Candidatus Kaiserbacteria bacterium CG10_big_fil_rev_8_21_14_0_10_49_17 TaxID=1974609 RepID=A0A2M6WEM8_9BACT|nr:MAG: hypothetical protein COU17_01320 [Candidatus Kaiserbacteria bacterium CG10_big_fil_rev_8_21_14_0_10_49_17]